MERHHREVKQRKMINDMLRASFCENNLKVLVLFSALFKFFFLHSKTVVQHNLTSYGYKYVGSIICSLLFEVKQES